jgi:hypothetical protein
VTELLEIMEKSSQTLQTTLQWLDLRQQYFDVDRDPSLTMTQMTGKKNAIRLRYEKFKALNCAAFFSCTAGDRPAYPS